MPYILVKLSILLTACSMILAAPAVAIEERGSTAGCPRGYGADANYACVPCNIGSAWTSGQKQPTACHFCVTNTYSTTAKASGCSSNCNLPQYQIVPDPNRIAGQPFGNVGCINLYNTHNNAKVPKV